MPNENNENNLQFRTFHVTLVVSKPLRFEYFPGFVLRNAISGSMAELHCRHYKSNKGRIDSCSLCGFSVTCNYSRFNFQTATNKTLQAFIVHAGNINSEKMYFEGEKIHFMITLFGIALDNLLLWIDAIKHIGEKTGIGEESGRFKLSGFGLEPEELQGCNTNVSGLTISFKSLHFAKTRKTNGKLLPFGKLITGIINRSNKLNELYGSGGIIYDNIGINGEVKSEESLKTARPLLYPPGGSHNLYYNYEGKVTYYGDLSRFSDLLQLGSRIGIGQFTTAGLGLYTIEYE